MFNNYKTNNYEEIFIANTVMFYVYGNDHYTISSYVEFKRWLDDQEAFDG